MRAHSGLAVACLVLGLADILYLDLIVAPPLLGDAQEAVVVAADIPAARRIPVAAGPAADGTASRGAAGERALDPELAVRTGAEPAAEPSGGASRGEPAVAVEPVAPRQAAAASEPPRRARPAESTALSFEPIYILFARDSAALEVRTRSQLDRAARSLSDEPALRAAIDGHADRHGEVDYNDGLSRRRAETVADYFAARGIDRARLTVRAFGERRPLDGRAGVEANRRNRRVEVRLSPSPPGAP